MRCLRFAIILLLSSGALSTDICDQTADIKITVGDYSGSKSEIYVFHLDDISHQSPGYGLVGSGTYTFEIGAYIGTLEHIGSNLDVPDYDYEIRLKKVGGDAKVTISDPDGMLGRHGSSGYTSHLHSNGKRVTVKVELDCPAGSTEPCCICGELKTCTECQAKTDPDCVWKTDKRTCVVNGGDDDDDGCPCDKCEAWYQEEKKDLEWKQTLNRELPCPCKANTASFYLEPINATHQWEPDFACRKGGEPQCSIFHPGADGCIRSSDSDNIGDAGQQCCYDSNGDVIHPPDAGAGTPDKVRGGKAGHTEAELDPYNWCCLECAESDEYCKKYIGPDGVREGDTSHCP